ncbi:MAG: nicotinate (nicotinamide) nucleotide adenylyltransferase [Terracidiphilus sp.]
MQQAGSTPDRGRRVAFFGGSFDPPHRGHLAVARAAKSALELDRVLFAPVGTQPLKTQGSTASFEDRLAMTRLAIAGEPGFEISLADAPKAEGGPNYSLETLEGLGRELAGGELYFLMGADSFFGLRNWHRAAEIPFAATLIVASRPGQPLKGVKAALPAGLTMEAAEERSGMRAGVEVRVFELRNRAGERAAFYLLHGLDVRISASDVREQLRAPAEEAAAARAWLPEAVREYVRVRGLYR